MSVRMSDLPPEVRTIRLALPLPPKECSPNARVHWRAKWRANARYRKRADLIARATVPASQRPRWEAAEIRWTWYLPDARRRDPDNLIASAKGMIDGLRDGDLIRDDNRLVLHPPTLLIDRANPRIELLITQVAA